MEHALFSFYKIIASFSVHLFFKKTSNKIKKAAPLFFYGIKNFIVELLRLRRFYLVIVI